MKLIINKDRSVIPIGTWGTKNENDFEIVDFEFPEELENYNKRIVYYLDDTKPWDTIVNNKAYITNAITSVENVKAYIWCTKENSERPADTDFRSQEFEMHFYKNENADGVVPTPIQVDGFNTILTTMNAKIDEVDALETTIETAEAERQEAESTRVSNENTRQSNESTRQTNEQTRQSQEAERERRTDEAIADIQDKTAEYNQNAQAKTTAFNNNATQKTNDFNNNYTQKVNDFNTNATTQKTDFNSNASSKTSAFNSNAETKTNAFNTNASNKTNDFNSNATEKTSAFNDNASTKTSEFNDNATSKTNDFNDNATEKTTAFNQNAQEKIDEYDEHIVDYQAQIDELQEEVDELSENMPWNTTEQATEINVDDAAKYSKNKLELFGNTEQDNTKMTYKCDGTETGDYYLTYNSIDYYFTMPTIVNGDILVFNTTDLKLYLGNTEITTESTGTGTNLTFISSPNPDYPQDIHVVTGNNIISIGNTNYPINLGSLELCKIGNYQDYLYKENGNWYKHGAIEKVVFNGTQRIEAMNTSSTNTARLIYKGIANRFNDGGICNQLRITGLSTWDSDIEGLYQEAWNDNFYFRINKSTIGTTTNEANAYLANNNLIFYGSLKVPTITQITDETLISQLEAIYNHLVLVKGTNNITVTAEDLAPYMKLTYMQDLPAKLDNLDSRLALLE